MDEKIVLIDGYSLLFRAFHALPLMDNGEGEYTNAVYGFMNMLLKVLDSEQPQALAVAFDVDKHTFRHESYADYKAGRAPTPEEMKGQIGTVKNLLELMNVPILQKQGYEADDILGTVSRICEESGTDCVLVTGDRDSFQLAGRRTRILYTKKGISETENVTPEWIKDKYGLEPRQLIDVKSLMGDASDNIPGVSGIGEKTAVKLIREFNSLDNLLSNAETELKGAVRDKIISGADSARMSRFLSEIDRNVPVDFDFDACRVGSFDAALPLLKKLKLRTIIEKLEQSALIGVEEHVSKPAFSVLGVGVSEIAGAIAEKFKNSKYVALTLGENLCAADESGLCLSAAAGGDLLSPGLTRTDLEKTLDAVRQLNAIRIFHNIKALDADISAFEGECEDVMLACYALNPQTEAAGVKDACEFLDADYSADAPAASLVNAWIKAEQMLKRDEVYELYRNIEMPLCFVLSDMENVGFRVDRVYLKQLGEDYLKHIDLISARVYERAGRQVNINSPKQLKQLLFDEMRLPVPGGKKSAASTNAETLEALAGDYPICADILEYRKYQKLYSTYIEGLLNQTDENGRVHTRFEQAVTGTGRISSREPNLQNIPVRTELGRQIRRAFIPAEGCVLIDADYSQIELRVLAALSGDAGMQKAFADGVDIHKSTAAEVFNVPLDMVTPEMRSRAKAVNFGVVYGISEYGLAKNTGTGVREAAGFIESYFDRYPAVKSYMDAQVALGRQNGYVKTLMGRRRYLKELASQSFQLRSFGERAAMNSPIQGTAADIIKMAMIDTYRELKRKGLRTRLILQVHDELIMEAPESEKDEAAGILTRCMENAAKLSVPLVAEAKTGGNWNECKP